MFFDSTEVEDDVGFSIADGWHMAKIEYTDFRENKSGTGKNLELHFLLDGKNIKVRDYLAIQHQNETAERIAKSKLKQICQAVGLEKLSRPEDLLGRKLEVRMFTNRQKTNEKGQSFAEVQDYRPLGKAQDSSFDKTPQSEGDLPF